VSAEILRRAAALMRERAEAATNSDWYPYFVPEQLHRPDGDGDWIVDSGPRFICSTQADGPTSKANAEHIASWHPAVALAVADLLDAQAALVEETGGFFDIAEMGDANALNVARAYLGETS
jgi:hypothetical protein